MPGPRSWLGRPYAAELRYELPEAEVAEVWKVFDAQDRETQVRTIERLVASGKGGTVLDAARRRLA